MSARPSQSAPSLLLSLMVCVCVCVCIVLLSFRRLLLFAHRLERRPIVQCLVLPGSALWDQRKQATPISAKWEQTAQIVQRRVCCHGLLCVCVCVWSCVCMCVSLSMEAEGRQFVTDYHQRDSAHSALIGIRSEYHHVESVERRMRRGVGRGQLPVVMCCHSPGIRHAL